LVRNNLCRIIRAAFILLICHTFLEASPKPPEYANDLGPDTIDVSHYPADMKAAYGIFQAKCGVCHSEARAVNSELVTSEEWNHYIKRMWLRPPCCNLCPVISKSDAKAIWKFLTYDSQVRKTGASAAAWQKQRQVLLAQFKAQYPEKYQEHYEPKERN
jgi:hypothetical protein